MVKDMDEQTTKKITTIYDIAKEAGVSPSTVSRVISGRGAVSPQKREIIQQIIEACEYKPNAFARGLQKSKSGIIGYVVPNIGSEYFALTYMEFEKHASADGYMVAVYNGKSIRSAESQIFKRLEEARVEAVVIMGGRIDDATLAQDGIDEVRQLNQKIPCVLCSARADDFGCTGIHTDDRAGAELAMRHLRDRGYHSVGFLGGYPGSIPRINKARFMKEYAEKYGLLFRPEWEIGNSFDEEDGARSMEMLLKQKELPEALYCVNDNVAIGAMGIAQDAGLRIPEDISLIGNDGIRLTEQIRPQVTTVAVDFPVYGKAIYEAVQAKLSGDESSGKILIPPHLIVRSTTR